jgi:hypothetical protein
MIHCGTETSGTVRKLPPLDTVGTPTPTHSPQPQPKIHQIDSAVHNVRFTSTVEPPPPQLGVHLVAPMHFDLRRLDHVHVRLGVNKRVVPSVCSRVDEPRVGHLLVLVVLLMLMLLVLFLLFLCFLKALTKRLVDIGRSDDVVHSVYDAPNTKNTAAKSKTATEKRSFRVVSLKVVKHTQIKQTKMMFSSLCILTMEDPSTRMSLFSLL